MRLTPEDWLSAGFDALTQSGASALAAEPLARRMGSTKGSFYWHFKDVPAFHTAMIEAWRTAALGALSQAVGADRAPDQRLRTFGQAILEDQTEAALRTWAHSNPAVAAALAMVDAERLTYLTLLLRELGLGNAHFARALQASLIGLPHLSRDAEIQRATYDTLVDTVLAL
jgi:AcrR family transcriptional regulator